MINMLHIDDLSKELDLKSNSIFITSSEMISKLMEIKYEFKDKGKLVEVKDKNKVVKKILEFMTYIESINTDNIVPVSQKTLEGFFNSRRYTDYLKILKEVGFMCAVPHPGTGLIYRYGKTEGIAPHCKMFRLYSEYQNSKRDTIIYINNVKEVVFNTRGCNVPLKFENTIKNCSINILDAIVAEIKNAQEKGYKNTRLNKRLSKLLNTQYKRYISKGINVDRIYNSFAGLSKVSRKHLNTKFYDVDVKNCQPLLLAGVSGNKDNQYKIDCEEGVFYERFYDLVESTEKEIRLKVKTSLYAEVFFDFKKAGEYNKKFKELYPNTWEWIDELYKNNGSLAAELQNLEASIFNSYEPKLSKMYFTVFDAVYFSDILDRPSAVKHIEEKFIELGLKVTVE